MLCVIDVGNTHTAIGVFEGESLVADWRVQTHDGRTSDEHGSLLHQLFRHDSVSIGEIEAAVMSCVVPPMEPILTRMARDYLGCPLAVVGDDVTPQMDVRVRDPSEVGADRLVNAIAARAESDAAQIVVDFGTATTFDAISADGAYLGGAITPGMTVSSEALFDAASKLPRVELAGPESVIGRTTVESVQAGLVHGYAGLTREIVARMTSQLTGDPRVVATGGVADLVVDRVEAIDTVDRKLTLAGLRRVYEGPGHSPEPD